MPVDPELNSLGAHQGLELGHEPRIGQAIGVTWGNRTLRWQVVRDDDRRTIKILAELGFEPRPIASMVVGRFINCQSVVRVGAGTVSGNQTIVDHGLQERDSRRSLALTHHSRVAPERGRNESNPFNNGNFALEYANMCALGGCPHRYE
jgi:hypothetical protein